MSQCLILTFLLPRLSASSIAEFDLLTLIGRLQALCAYTRMAWAAAWLVLGSGLRFSVAYVDQVPVGVPLVRLLSMLGRFVRRRSGPRTVFYVHYPDQLLTDRTSSLKRLYRAPIDALERTCIANADCLLANSRFTGTRTRRAPSTALSVLYMYSTLVSLVYLYST